jgi:transketolase
MRNSFVSALTEYSKTNPKIVLATGDLGYGVLDEFSREFPDRFINFGINEQSMMSACAGMAKIGLIPFVYSIANFNTFRCLEQIRNDVCYMDLNVNIISIGSGFSYGTSGYSHHLLEDFSIMSALPNLQIYTPCDGSETRKSLELILKNRKPSYMRIGKGGERDLSMELVSNQNLYQENPDLIFLFSGPIGENVLSASKVLIDIGYRVLVLSVFSDHELEINNILTKYPDTKIVTVEEHLIRGGMGSMVLEVKNSLNLHNRILRLGVSRHHGTFAGSQSFLRETHGLNIQSIVMKSLELLNS